MEIKIINKSAHPLPAYQTSGAAAVDLTADIEWPIPIPLQPHIPTLIPTGLYIAIPEGYEAQIRPRSGLAVKGVTVLNSPGTIDSDYRGEIKVLLINHGTEPYHISNGDRIAQMVFAKREQAVFVEVEQLPDSERGSGGFGSTGK